MQELTDLQWQGKRPQGIHLRDGGFLQARQFLIDSWPGSIELPPGVASALLNRPKNPQYWVVSGLKSPRPAIMAPMLILGGEPPCS
ncbi:MAG: hypothetical protein R2864_12120 [Syntrophotaleaceae bacterium]